MADRPFRFGVSLGSAPTLGRLRDRIRIAEDAGFSRIAFNDHFSTAWAPLPALAYAAALTSKVRLTNTVLDVNVRHPSVLARDAATIDVLSDGRFELGIGAGSQPEEHPRFVDLPRASGSVRRARLAEALAIIKGLWAPGEFSFQGKHYSIDRLDGMPKPVRQPRPPIRLGGFGRHMLTLAAREADIVNPWIHWDSQAGPAGARAAVTAPQQDAGDVLAEKLGWIREAAGDRFDQLEIELYCFAAITDDPDQAAQRHPLARIFYPAGPAAAVRASPDFLFGPAGRIADILLERREKFGIATYQLSGDDRLLRDFGPVIERLDGC
jgi:probable F420-dependent oxidoreductase